MGSIGANRNSSSSTASTAPAGFDERAEEYIGGGIDVDEVFSEEDLDYISKNLKNTEETLYRVEDSRYTADLLDQDELDGDDFKFNGSFRSFTSNMDFIKEALDQDSDAYAGIRNPVIFEITGTKKAFDMSKYANAYASLMFTTEDQKESFVGGRFETVGESVRKLNGKSVRVIKLRQK